MMIEPLKRGSMIEPIKRRRAFKRRTHTVRTLLPLQKLIVAREMQSGASIKTVAADWKISRAYAHKIFVEYLEYKIVWRPDKEPYPTCKEGVK